jgi:predicted metal-dependent hydrolase
MQHGETRTGGFIKTAGGPKKRRGYRVAKAERMRAGAYELNVARKNIKNLYLRVLPPDGAIWLHVPLHTSETQISRFVLSRAAWIDKQLARQAGHGPRLYEDGDIVAYFGKRLTLRLLYRSGRVNAQRKGDTLELTVRSDADADAKKKALDAWYRAELYEAAGAMLPPIERTVGRRAGELRVRDMKTRWGTCNTKTGNITLNLRLAEKPAECLRYVITHELCHLHETGHTERFWRRMDEYYPDWKRARKLLKEKT